MINKDKIYIIVVTYNAMPWIAKCLESTKPYSVIVVDNSSTDKTLDFIKKKHPEITVIAQDTNLGFGQANNIGISYALSMAAGSVFLLNQDAYLMDDCLDQLIKIQKHKPEYAILSPVHLNGEGNLLDRNFSLYVRFDSNPNFYSDFILNKPKKEVYEVPFVNAAGWLLSKKCLETVGGFDPIFFHYGEDDNYCQRVQYHGLKVGVVPTSFLMHDRENREVIKPEKNSAAFFKNWERSKKLKYADINNTEALILLENDIKRIERTIIKLKLKFRLASAANLNKQLRLLQKIKVEVKSSRELNVKKGSHYL
jgi:GT2 family glycosyltransferase